MTDKADRLEGVRIVDKTAAASLTNQTLEEIDMVCNRDKACTTVKRLNKD